MAENIPQAIEDYLTDCRARGLSMKTIKDAYGYALKEVLQPWLEEHHVRSLDQVDAKLLSRWQANLLSQPRRRGRLVSRHSIQSWIRATNSFLAWAKANGEMAAQVRAKAPQAPRKLVEVLSREQVDQLERQAQTERDKLIVRLLADTGIRASELLGLRGTDLLDRERRHYLRIHGKGDKERLVPVPRLGVRILRFNRGQPPEERLFLTLRRTDGERQPLTLSGLQKMLAALGRELELRQKVAPHLFRHSFATHALANGMNPIQLADILGHESLVMIQRNYSHLSSRDAYEAAVKLFSPQ